MQRPAPARGRRDAAPGLRPRCPCDRVQRRTPSRRRRDAFGGAYPLCCGRRGAARRRRGGANGRHPAARGAEHRGQLGECVAALSPAAIVESGAEVPPPRCDWSVTARPRRWSTKDSASGSPAASGLSAGRGPFRAEPFATVEWFGHFPTLQPRNCLQWVVSGGEKHAQNPRGWRLSYRSQIAKISSRRCAPIGAARASAPMAQW